jgi:phosphatidylinositol-3,4,5-trisphosphate 3-phosphatase/dual-specificity protein phosphatase PTEN
MGYPAVGFSALYRNRRRDVLRFINARHANKWWIWNLCPLYENAYSPESMHSRVSRYPFPDHHPPPLPLLPLAVREMTAWLEGDKERVVIIHCKAGKVRVIATELNSNRVDPVPYCVLICFR